MDKAKVLEEGKAIMLSFDIMTALRRQKEKVRVDGRGHTVGDPFKGSSLFSHGATSASLFRLAKAVKAGNRLGHHVKLGSAVGYRCSYCGEEYVWESNGKTLRTTTACPHPNGLELTFELNVPSGVLIVANDLRGHFDVEGDYDINTSLGCVKTTLAMANIGCAHAFVGNTCPGVYAQGTDRFIVVNPAQDAEYEEIPLPNARQVASICTDLWWYSMVDGDEYRRRGCRGKYEVDRVKVRPGVYRFTHHVHQKGFDRDAEGTPIIFSTIEWVRPPDPVRDFKAEARAKNFTAGQVIASSMRQYPSLYDGEDAAMKVANHIFCVIGGGGSWHPNGFVQYDPDMTPNMPEAPIPVFNQAFNWYPMCEYSGLVKAAKGEIHLNPSFVSLARNVCACIIEHGSGDRKESKGNVKIARQCLADLEKRYDEQGNPSRHTAKKRK